MLLIKTKLGLSKIHGIGLFADNFIKKGTVIWKFNPLIDIYIPSETLRNLSRNSREQISNYIYMDKFHKKNLLCGDDARFFNHSFTPNCDDSLDGLTIAKKNIKSGEELTVNYYDFDKNASKHFKKISDTIF
jgi:SET domain-containing protein